MRSFKCVHASAAGWAGMDLGSIVLDFYDRNCADCKKRVPVMLPNISELVAKRDNAAAATRRDNEARLREEHAAYEKRRLQRQALSEKSDDTILAIFDAVDSLDRDPSAHNDDVLTQLAVVTPQRFDSRVQEALFAIAEETTSSTIMGTVLGVLRQVNAEPNALCNAALRILAHDALHIAGTIVAENATAEQADAVAGALPSLIALAGPRQEYLRTFEAGDEHPEGLIAAFRIAPDSVAKEIERMLRNPAKLARIRAVHAIRLLRETNSRFGIELIPALVQSTQLPDNHYDLGSAESCVQTLLADLLESRFDEVDASLTESFKLLHGHDPDVGLDQVYLRVFRSHRREKEAPPRISHVHEVLFGRLLNYLSTKCAEQGSLQLLEFLRHDAERYVDLVERHVDALLGAMAILTEEEVSASSSFLQLHLPPNPFAALEAGHRKNALHWLVDAVAQLIGKTAAQRPEVIGRALLSVLERVDEEHDNLKAALVMALGGMAQNRRTLPLILPPLYGAMTGRSQRVRAAAATAYGKVINRDPDDLPPLLHDTFITLLSDPYVVVHSAALEVLDRRWLPSDHDQRLTVIVFELVRAHSGAEGNKHILKLALDVFLGFERREGDLLRRPAVAKFVVDMIIRCEPYDAAKLLCHHAKQLMPAPNFVKSVLQILSDDAGNEYRVDDLLDVLREVSAAQIRPVADEFVAAIHACSLKGHYVVDRGVEMLTAAGLWGHAVRLSELEETRWGDSQWDRPRKLQSQMRVLECSIEQASSRGDLRGVKEFLAEFRRVEKERNEDERKHHARRDPLHGIADANQGA